MVVESLLRSLPFLNSCFGSGHLYGLNCQSCPVVRTQMTRSLRLRQERPGLNAEYAPSVLPEFLQCLDTVNNVVFAAHIT